MDTAQFLTDLRVQRDRIDQAIAALEALSGAIVSSTKTATKATSPAPGIKPIAAKRVISAEARQRMAEAQQKRWAKKKRAVKVAAKKTASVAPLAVKSAKAAPVASPAAKGARNPMSESTKKKLAAAAKARWAAKKSAAKTA